MASDTPHCTGHRLPPARIAPVVQLLFCSIQLVLFFLQQLRKEVEEGGRGEGKREGSHPAEAKGWDGIRGGTVQGNSCNSDVKKHGHDGCANHLESLDSFLEP